VQGLEGKSLQQLERQLRESWAESVVTNWKIWVPCQIVNLGFVPGHLQVKTTSVFGRGRGGGRERVGARTLQ